MEFTPAMATEWLASKWGEQRPVRAGHVNKLAADMAEDRFRISPDAILRVKGKLANGQHRLEAVVQSNTKQTFLVMESNDEELYKIVDAGLKRTVSDSLLTMPYNKNIPSMAKWAIAYENGTVFRSQTSPSKGGRAVKAMTQSAMIDYCIENQDLLIQAAQFVCPLYMETRLLSFSIGGAIYCIAATRHKLEKAKQFLTAVYRDGGNDAAGDFRNRLIQIRGQRVKEHQGYIFGIAIKAFKSYCNGTRPVSLKWAKDEGLPTI